MMWQSLQLFAEDVLVDAEAEFSRWHFDDVLEASISPGGCSLCLVQSPWLSRTLVVALRLGLNGTPMSESGVGKVDVG